MGFWERVQWWVLVWGVGLGRQIWDLGWVTGVGFRMWWLWV